MYSCFLQCVEGGMHVLLYIYGYMCKWVAWAADLVDVS